MLAGIQMAIGTIGTLLVTAPLAFASATIGWRATFFCVAGLVVLCGALIAIVVREDAAEHAPAAHGETLRENFAGIVEVVRMRGFWPLFLMQAVSYSSYAMIVGLWGGPYLAHVYGYGLAVRGDLLMLPALSQIVGVVVWGHAQRVTGSYKPLVLAGALATATALGLLAVIGKPEPWMLAVWLAVFGALPAFLPVLIAHGRSLLPPHLVGRGMTLFNIGSMGGTFVVQLASGALIDAFVPIAGAYPLDAYRAVFAAQAVAVLAACGIYAVMRPKNRSAEP
jgi:predicted MFS family arabinose efflux permease